VSMKRVLLCGCLSAALGAGCATAEPAPRRARGSEGGDLPAAISLYNQAKYAEAEAVLRRLGGAEAQAYLAACLAKQQKYPEAEALAKAVIAANPTHALAVAALGQSLVGQGKNDEAIERLSAAITAWGDADDKADAAYAFFWRGQAHYRKGQFDRMVADFEIFLRLAQQAPEANTVRQLLAGVR